MAPEQFRITLGVAGLFSSLAALSVASPAFAQGITVNTLMGAAPMTIAVGAGAFGLLAIALIRKLLRDGRASQDRAQEQIAGLRALVDEYEGLLSGSRELVVLWSDRSSGPRILGQSSVLLPAGRRPEGILDFAGWLGDAAADAMARALEGLKVRGRGFEQSLVTRDGRLVRASGWVMGGGTALRLRLATAQPTAEPETATPPIALPTTAEPAQHTARAIIAGLGKPTYLRDAAGTIVFANEAYRELAAALGRGGSEARPAELVEAGVLGQIQAALRAGRKPEPVIASFSDGSSYEVVEFAITGGSVGSLQPRREAGRDAGLSHLSAIIDALATPIAIFNPKRELVQFNRAYISLWGLDPRWLKPGMDERAILDKLRTDGKLPNEPDYQDWRARHLESYQLRAPKELGPWYLPDGRAVQVIAAPAGPKGGVIYVFEDITDQLKLRSQHKAVLDVQRSTLNALSEAVAVFGTNGRLTLSNPRLSVLWKLPSNLLSDEPHIDQMAAAAARALPEDGLTIWRNLKREIIDLNPTRSDRQGRIARADGKLIDYAVTRLPDGQTMMTFLDVTESANYQRVLKERNDALVTADRLKDAFVQNVSYELRSPLTNIIGFADLLASGTAGDLNEKQHAYTDYIRASSVTLGVLIDNILDLATVDAGVAELRPEPQDVQALVEKARAGLAASFPEVDGERRLNLRVEIAPNLPPLVADGTRIVQVLYNLLSSAARFSEPGGEVRLAVSARGERMIFLIEDDGAAMSEEMRAAMLDTEPTSISARQRGAGLGLAIVRAFVNLHGGTIAVEKREPRGSRVVVSMPLDASAVAGAAE